MNKRQLLREVHKDFKSIDYKLKELMLGVPYHNYLYDSYVAKVLNVRKSLEKLQEKLNKELKGK